MDQHWYTTDLPEKQLSGPSFQTNSMTDEYFGKKNNKQKQKKSLENVSNWVKQIYFLSSLALLQDDQNC